VSAYEAVGGDARVAVLSERHVDLGQVSKRCRRTRAGRENASGLSVTRTGERQPVSAFARETDCLLISVAWNHKRPHTAIEHCLPGDCVALVKLKPVGK
jgi:hypothetical protein